MDLPIIEGRIKRSLLEIIRKRAPHEAVGIIYNDLVYELRNDADYPVDSFAVDRNDLRRLVETLMIPVAEVGESVVLWHSHPAGGVGPSREDMKHKTPLQNHLVVALVEDDIVATWY
jgi:proteasome lid subunit RPN8/RPN11